MVMNVIHAFEQRNSKETNQDLLYRQQASRSSGKENFIYSPNRLSHRYIS